MRRFVSVLAVMGLVALMSGRAHAGSGYDWPQFDGNSQHSGDNTLETAISPGNVSSLHVSFQASLPGVADGAPVYESSVRTSGGTRDLLFLTTRNGYIVALDAHTGATIWKVQHGPGSCTINRSGTPCYTTSSPALDPNRLYIYSYGLDGRVYKYAAGTGAAVTSGGWPQRTTLKPYDEKGSSALSIATTSSGVSYLYVTNGGYPGDNGDYQGHVTAISLAGGYGGGTQHVFNTLCSNKSVHFVEKPGTPDCPQVQSAVWARVGTVYDPANGKLYIATGNGPYAPSSYDWADSVLALHPDGTGASGKPIDSYTPSNYQQLQGDDADLGSTAPAILPVPSGSAVQNVAVQGGKDAMLRLINLDNLSGQNGPGHTGGELQVLPVPQGGEVLTQPAVWTSPADGSTWAFVANGNGISGLRLGLNSQNVPQLQAMWSSGTGGTSPIVADNVLFDAGSNLIEGLDPATGQQLWQSTAIGGIHWESPVVANGTLYITDENGHVTAFTPS